MSQRQGINRVGYGSNDFQSKGDGIIRAVCGSNLLPLHPVTNFDIQKFYQIEFKFNGVYSRDNLPDKIKDGTYVINLDEYFDTGTHWIALHALNNNVTYFDSFGVEYIPKEIEKPIKGFVINASTIMGFLITTDV